MVFGVHKIMTRLYDQPEAEIKQGLSQNIDKEVSAS